MRPCLQHTPLAFISSSSSSITTTTAPFLYGERVCEVMCARPTSLTWKMQFMWKHAWRLAPLCSPLAANSVESAKLNLWFFQLQSIDHRSRTRCRVCVWRMRQIYDTHSDSTTYWTFESWSGQKRYLWYVVQNIKRRYWPKLFSFAAINYSDIQ
jgi:hypothetical protein